MLSLKTLPSLHRSSVPFKSLLFRSCPSPPSLFSPPSPARPSLTLSAAPAAFSASSAASSATKMAAAAATTVEHVVLFKVRDSTDPSKIEAMISNLRSLVSLDIASHLVAGPILRHRSAAASAAGFTHLLHSRYRSKPDLAAYSGHAAHQGVVKEHVLPICDGIMALDWVADLDGPAAPPPGSAMRLTLAKPKEEAAAAELLAAIEGAKGAVPSAWQVSYGENFSPARAKGYSVGFLSVFPGVEELDALDGEGKEAVEAHKEKVRPLLESLIVVDFVVPPPPAASL